MVQLFTRLQARIAHLESIHVGGVAGYPDIHVAQPNRFTHPDVYVQQRLFLITAHLDAITVVVVAQCFAGLPGLLHGTTLIAAQAGKIMAFQVADQGGDVGIERLVFGFADHFQPRRPACL